MLRFRGGDESAFDELVRRNTHKVHALVYRFLGGTDEVDDITQEVFLRVYRTAERYQPTAKFSTWLYRIVANLCFNVMRTRRRKQMWQLGQVAGADEDSQGPAIPDPRVRPADADLRGQEIREIIAAAVAMLPDKQRIALILHQYEEKPYDEIAGILSCSTMAVKSLLSRAREGLRHSLRKHIPGRDRGEDF